MFDSVISCVSKYTPLRDHNSGQHNYTWLIQIRTNEWPPSLWIAQLSGYPRCFRERHWLSMGLPEISRVAWQLWDHVNHVLWTVNAQVYLFIVHYYSNISAQAICRLLFITTNTWWMAEADVYRYIMFYPEARITDVYICIYIPIYIYIYIYAWRCIPFDRS